MILRPEGRIYFANAQPIGEKTKALVEEYKHQVVTLGMSRVFDIEYSALQMLIHGEKRINERGAILWLAALNPGVRRVVQISGFADQLGKERLLYNARTAIKRFPVLKAREHTKNM